MFYAALAVALLVFGSFAWTLTARAAYESAEYKVIERDGEFELREYPDLMLASTNMRPDSQGNDGSFMRLFRYISGGNDGEQKVAMTTPVFMADEAEGQTEGTMGFVIPKEVAIRGVPKPASGDVQIRKRDGGRFAVIRFSGRMDQGVLSDAEAKLRTWVKAKGLKAGSEFESAGYDPPWTPGPLRRNEVLIRIDSSTAETGQAEIKSDEVE
jgi:DNA gyrase inhibitor GyrI